jgi:hypothetical protein
MNVSKMDNRLNGERFDNLRTLKYCSICEKPYHETEREHWELNHKK